MTKKDYIFAAIIMTAILVGSFYLPKKTCTLHPYEHAHDDDHVHSKSAELTDEALEGHEHHGNDGHDH